MFVSLSVGLCAQHPKHACGQRLNEPGPKRCRDSKQVRETPPKTVGTYFEQLFHLVTCSSAAAAGAGAAFFRILTLCYVLQMTAKTHGRGDSVCSWPVPVLHAGFLFHFEAFGKLLTSLSHQY